MIRVAGAGRGLPESAAVPIGRASFPAPFRSQLEFNPPVHGTWNIVHIGMRIPEAHQVYVCGINCMRGVVLTAAEMEARGRFSCVILKDEDILKGNVEQVTIDGILDVVGRLPKTPPCVLVFPVCTHHFLGCDMNYIYRRLREARPDVTFVPCWMDPIMQKHGLTPEQKLRRSMFEPLAERPARKGVVSLIGYDFPLRPSEMDGWLEMNAISLHDLPHCTTYEEYLALAEAELFVAVYPTALPGAPALAKRLGRPYLYLPLTFDAGEIRSNMARLAEALGLAAPDLTQAEQEAMAALREARELIGDTEIRIDMSMHPRPLGLAKLLLDEGFRVTCLYQDAISGEEKETFFYLKEHYPELVISSVIRPEMRFADRHTPDKVLALGQKAAYFSDTPYFVNMVAGGGLIGFAGIRDLAGLMKEAYLTPKDTRDLVVRKGLGCASCV